MTAEWIINQMEAWAPSKWAMENDNVGLMVGDKQQKVSRVLTALDLTEAVLTEAVAGKYNFIVTHHPLFSRHIPPVMNITSENVLGKKILTLIKNSIGLFSAHTNLDAAQGGVNDILFDKLGLCDKEPLAEPSSDGFPVMGRIGYLNETVSLSDYAEHVKKILSLKNINYAGKADTPIKKVGLCGGNGTSLIGTAIQKKCDVFITGDIGYHTAVNTSEAGMAIIDGTHYASEVFIAEAIAGYLMKAAESQGQSIFVKHAGGNG